jgi:REP element-mobilizing transposase RayT
MHLILFSPDIEIRQMSHRGTRARHRVIYTFLGTTGKGPRHLRQRFPGPAPALYGHLRLHPGRVFRRLAAPKESRVEEGHPMLDRVHMMLSIPPKHAVSQGVGFIKGQRQRT